MERLRFPTFLFLPFLLPVVLASGQTSTSAPSDQPSIPAASAQPKHSQAPAPPIPADAPRMSKQTRVEIIRDFEMQILYARTTFPMGSKGLKLKNGITSPGGQELQQAIAIWGPAIKPGDPAHISYVQIKDDHIHFDLNGGPVHRKKWYQHIEVSGAGGTPVPLSNDKSTDNPHGSYLDIYFDKYVPEMSAAQLREILLPVLDFNARN